MLQLHCQILYDQCQLGRGLGTKIVGVRNKVVTRQDICEWFAQAHGDKQVKCKLSRQWLRSYMEIDQDLGPMVEDNL